MEDTENLPSPACSVRSCADSLLEDFAALRSIIKPNGLINIASQIRGVGLAECTVDIERPLYGSFNIVYVITFFDNLKWAARIPLHGVKDLFNWNDAKALESQAMTLRLIRQNTNMPVPEVVYYDTTFENELGAPFLLMTWLEGIPVNSAWHDSGCETQALEKRRERMLRSTAKAMIQLRFFTASKLGELEFESINDEGGKLRLKGIKNLHSFHLAEDSEDVMFTDLGPFEHTRDFLHALAKDSRPDRSFSHFALGQQKILQIIIDAVPTPDHEHFVLTHPDYDGQNFLVDEEGSLVGILDWDGVAAYPRCLGCTRYPGWITRDWDPLVYSYDHEDPDGGMEDSHETLKEWRKLYHRIMEEELGEAEAKGMINSHLFEAIEIAARNPMNSSAIINLLIRKCIKEPLFDVFPGDGHHDGGEEEQKESSEGEDRLKEFQKDDQDHENDMDYLPLWVLELCEALGKGRVSEEQIDMLKKRFNDILTCTIRIVE